MVTKIILAFISLIYSVVVSAEYQPSFSFEKYVKTITVHADGTNEVVTEATDKIETEKGIAYASQSDLSYIKGMQRLEILDAYTIRPNGTKVKVRKENIRERDDPTSNGADMFSDTKHKIIIYPEVNVGSKLYSKVKTTNFKSLFKDHFLYSEVTLPYYKYGYYEINFIVNKGITLNFDNKGFTGGFIKETKDSNIYKFTYSQETVTSIEPGMVSLYDVSNHLFVSSFKDYAEYGRAYQRLSEPKAKPTAYIQGLADIIIAKSGGGDKRAEAKVLYEWIVNNIRYVAVYVADGGVNPHFAESVVKNGYGDCKDHAVLYEALLAARGIKSSPALINSGEAFTLPKYPVLAPQNHVITYIPELDLYVDATSQNVPFGYVPFEVRDKPTVLTALNKIGRTPAMKAYENIVRTTVKFKIQPDGKIDGVSTLAVSGPIESSYRENQVPNVGKDDAKVASDLLSLYGETGIGKLQFTKPNSFNERYEENGLFTLDPIANYPGPAAMTIPVGLTQGRIYTISREKPLVSRKYPYSCFGRTYQDYYTLEFPKKTKITRIPSNVNYSNNNMTYKATYKRENNVIFVNREMILDNKNMFCEANRETEKNAFFNALQKDLRSQIFYE
jgi:hypothetical protein